MDKTILSSISIEKFAAFLDGNLLQEEMDVISQLAEQENTLHQLLNASSVIDDTIASYTEADLLLPPEITGSSFEIPDITNDDISMFVTLNPEPDDILAFSDAIACASADEDDSLFHTEDDIHIDDVDIPDINDDFVNFIPGNDNTDG